jgi:hypothetical protein
MTNRPIIEEAGDIVAGARNTAYGGPEDNFLRIARLWNAHLENIGLQGGLKPADVGAMMGLMKQARLAQTPDHRDSLVDIIGYAVCQARCVGLE